MANPQSTGSNLRLARFCERAIILLSVALVLFGLRAVVLGDSTNSRLATVLSLVHDGTWRIDRPAGETRNPFEAGSVDKVEIDGRLLSSKPPLLPLAMTAEYYLLHQVLGWSIDDRASTLADEAAQAQYRATLKRTVQFMTLTLTVLPYLVMALFFALILAMFIDNPWQRLLPLAALTWATQLPGFATQLNNHTSGTAALVVALYFALGLTTGKLSPRPRHFLAFGLAGGLVFTLDMPLTIYIALSGLYLLYRFPRQALLWGGLGMFPPLALHFGVMIAVTGSPLPVQTNKAYYLYESAAWRNPGGLDGLNEPKGTYAFHVLFGRFGTFLLFPVLIVGLLGPVLVLFSQRNPLRGWILAGFAAFILLTIYYISSTNNYGGAAYGFRWHLGSMPILLLLGIPLFQRITKPWHALPLAPLFLLSLYSAWECYLAPWGEQHEWTCRLLFGSAY